MDRTNLKQPPVQEKKSYLRSVALLPQTICCHLFGEEHPIVHRIIAGIVICVLGTIFTKIPTSSEFLKVCSDVTGLSLHGIGLTPIIERMAKK